jgi:methylenetetrahydrofolate dehydrogenase (NADP+)/methenyltetrahydrofolate cyclohydrolase
VSARRLEGKALLERRKAALSDDVATLAKTGRAPRLVVVLATEDEAAVAYARAKQRAGEALGIGVEVVHFEHPTTEALVDKVGALGCDDSVDGILIETPLPSGIDLRAVQDAIPDAKDVDGAGTFALGCLSRGVAGFVPATAAAVLALLDGHGVEISGRHAVVVGRSLVVGRPLSQLLLARDATVTVCHSRTRDLAAVTRTADILCVAIGCPRFLIGSMVKPGAVVIDVGTTVVEGKLVGDVDVDTVAAVAGAVSPVPGGVGPLTTIMLLENVARAARLQRRQEQGER